MTNSTPASNAIRTVFRGAAVTYTVIVLFLCFILTGLSDGSASVVAPLNFLLVFPFSLCFSVANYLHRSRKLGGFLKFLFHLVLTVGGFFCFLYLPAFSDNSDSSSLIVLAAFTACYLLVYGVIILFSRRWKKEFRSEEDYEPQFSASAAPDSSVGRKKKQ